MGPLTRQEYEELTIRRQMERFGTPEAEARKTHELRYPRGTVAAILELELRGLRSSDWRVLAFVDERPDEAPFVGISVAGSGPDSSPADPLLACSNRIQTLRGLPKD